jgi:hypothetical protein
MSGRNLSPEIAAAIFLAVCIAALTAALHGCSDTNTSMSGSIPDSGRNGCLAFNCHPATPLSLYPPSSGEHRTHLGTSEYGPKLECVSCHQGYRTNLRHRNGFINGYNWLLRKKTPGMTVYFGTGVSASSSFDQAASTCSGTGTECHGSGASGNWYSGAGGTCGESASCHAGPPLNQFPPATGAHAIHRYKNYNCSTCHADYYRNVLHKNTFVNGSALDPKYTAAVPSSVVFFNTSTVSSPPTWNNTTAGCGNSSCHSARNWYSYTLASECPVCHEFPPLSQSLPNTGRHGKHRGEGYNCLVCHKDYAAGNTLHNNGMINGSALDPLATVFGNIVFFTSPPAGGSSFFNTSNGNCSNVGTGCHEGNSTENWYSGED